MNIITKACEWHEIERLVNFNIKNNKMTIDSFLEDHIVKSRHYKILSEEQIIGYFFIYDSCKLMGFYMDEYHSQYSQEVFNKVKKYEQVTHAMVATSDEYFLSHCLDNYASITKQAYFSIYTDKAYEKGHFHQLDFYPVLSEEDIELLNFSGDFICQDDRNKIKNQVEYYKLFIMKQEEENIGVGVVEYGRVDTSIASVGMFVAPEFRQKGYGRSILKALQMKVESEGYIARSGCWYYNHNSKKSMESAGAYSKTRLLNIQF